MENLIILEDTNINDNVISILKSIGFVEHNNIFEKTIKNRFIIKILLNKQVSESIYMKVVNNIIVEDTNIIDVKVEITDKKSGKTETVNTQFSANKETIIRQLKQIITDKFLKNNNSISKLITSGLSKLDENELSAFEFFYGEKLEKILKQLGK